MLQYLHSQRRLDNLIIDPEKEVEFLKKNSWIDSDNKLLPKSISLLNSIDELFKKNRKKVKSVLNEQFEKNVSDFLNIFPTGKLPTGKVARTGRSELNRKLVAFVMENPQYTWDVILDAADLYVDHFRKQNYQYMKTAGNFVKKDNESDLASYCDMILSGEADVKASTSMYTVK